MTNQTNHVRALYAEIPTSTHEKMEICMSVLGQNKKTVVTEAIEMYCAAKCPAAPTKPSRTPAKIGA